MRMQPRETSETSKSDVPILSFFTPASVLHATETGDKGNTLSPACVLCNVRLSPGQFFGIASHQMESEWVSISAREYEPLREQPWHLHERPTFFVHLSGEQLDETPAGEWPMPSLSLTYHPARLRHRSRLGPRGARGVNIEVSAEWLLGNGVHTDDLGHARVLGSFAARTAALRLVRIYGPSVVPQPELDDMLLDLIEAMVVLPPGSDAGAPSWLPKVEDRIAAEFRNPIGLAGLARSTGVHPVHLARVFRSRHGCSVTEHIQRLRIHAAIGQILQGDAIGVAALDAGFADQFHFTRILKAHFGYCPKIVKRLRCCDRS